MSYLQQKHSQVLLISFIVISILLVTFPNIDIEVSRYFFSEELGKFSMKKVWWVDILYESCRPVIIFSVIGLIILWQFNKYKGTKFLSVDGRRVACKLLILLLGAGLIVNAIFKDQFGRARPRHIVEFHGTQQFTPAFVITDQCDKNCSFSSGHGAGAYFTLALALLFRNRKRALAVAFVYGTSVSIARIAAGGHFFSDNIVSFFVMALTTDLLYYIFYKKNQEPSS